MKTNPAGVLIPLTAGVLLTWACVKDPTYNVENLDSVDASMTLFSGGLELPLGQTDSITMADVMKMDGMEALDSILKKDSKGNYSISAEGEYNLDEVIEEMQLEKLRDINGSSFSTAKEYKIGDFTPEQFRIDGLDFTYQSEDYGGFNLDDIPMPSFNPKDQVINTKMYRYLPQDTDLGKKVGKLENTSDIMNISSLASKIPASTPDDTEISVQTFLDQLEVSSVNLDFQKKVDQSILFGDGEDEIADVKNYTLSSGGTLKVELSAVNCPLTDGTVTPDLDLDISSMLVLADANPLSGKLDLSSLSLSKANGWAASKEYVVSSLADNFPEFANEKLAIKGQMDVSGQIIIAGAKSTPGVVKSLVTKKMQLKVAVSLNGVIISEMDVTLGPNVSYTATDAEIPVSLDYDLPSGVKSVEKVYFKDDSKLSVSLAATGLSVLKTIDGTKHVSLVPDVELTFPEGLEVEGAVNGKVVIQGEDLYNGAISKQYTLVSITPTVTGRKLQFKGTATAKVKAVATGSFSTKYLPKGESDDITVTSHISGKTALKDYNITLDKQQAKRTVDESREFSVKVEGLDDFGTFNIELEGSPVASVVFDIPKTTELGIVAENLVITLPEMLVVDGSAIQGFDAAKNTVTINGELPERIDFPIQYLKVTPQSTSGGQSVIKGTCSAKGDVGISEEKITRTTFDELNGKKIKVAATIPSLKAKSISAQGDFSKSLDYEGKDIVFLDEQTLKDLPSEVKSIGELDFENVNALIEIQLQGLPDMQGGTFSLKGTRVQLPDFLYGENDSHELILDDEIVITEGKSVVQKAQLTKIKDVQLEGMKEIKGDVKFSSTLYSKKPSIDVSTLKSTIVATIKIGVGNGASADHPGKIAISKAVVRAGYNIENIQSISFGDVPSEFQDGNISLSLNPQMHLTLTTNFGAPVTGDFVLTPYIGGKSLESVSVKGIELPCSSNGKTISNKYAIGLNVEASVDEKVIDVDLSKLIKRIPDSISVAIKVNLDKNKDCTIYPSADYTLDMNYSFCVPLNLGGSTLEFSRDIDAPDGIEDYIRRSGGSMSFSGTCLTNLPVGVSCVITLLDKDDRQIETTSPVKFSVTRSPDGSTVCINNFDVAISIKDYKSAVLSKIRLAFEGSASDASINENQFIKLDALKFKLPKGLTVEE